MISRLFRALCNLPAHSIALWRMVATFRNWRLLASDYFWHRETLSFNGAVFRSDGCRIHLDTQGDLSNLWAIFGREEYSISPRDTQIVDIGANCGLFSIFVAKRNLKANVISFEPVASTFKALRRNIELCRISDRVQTRQAGVAGSTGIRQIYLGAGSDLSSLFATSQDQESEAIETVSINSVLQGIQSVSVLKMDCEGAEWEILEAADPSLFAKVDRMYVEFHALTPARMQTARSLLSRLGFVQTRIQVHSPGTTAVVWADRQH